MKILYISDRINASDGSAVHGRAFVRSAACLGHEVRTYPGIADIAITPGQDRVKSKGLVYYFRKVNLRTLKYYLTRSNRYLSEITEFVTGIKNSVIQFTEIRALLKSYSPDVIVFRAFLFHFAALWIAKMYKIPLIVEVNSFRSIEAKVGKRANAVSFITERAERQPILFSDAVFAVSAALKRHVDRYSDPARSFVIPNGVDTETFDPTRFDRDQSKKKLGLEGKTIAGYIGSYKVWHGLEISIRVVELLAQTDPNYHLLLIGNGTEHRKITQLVEKKDLQRFVTQIHHVAHEDVPEHLAAFDYALMTYPHIDQFYFSPLKMFEYLAMGIPIISTDIGQISEIITHNRTGILVSPPTAANFAKAVLAIQRDQVKRATIQENTRRLAVEKYSWLSNARRVMMICESVLESSRPHLN